MTMEAINHHIVPFKRNQMIPEICQLGVQFWAVMYYLVVASLACMWHNASEYALNLPDGCSDFGNKRLNESAAHQ